MGLDPPSLFPSSKAAYCASHFDTPAGASARFRSSLVYKRIGHRTGIHFWRSRQTWAEKWSSMAAYFGLVGAGPGDEGGFDATGWVMQHKVSWFVLDKEHDLKVGIINESDWDFFSILYITLDRQLDTVVLSGSRIYRGCGRF